MVLLDDGFCIDEDREVNGAREIWLLRIEGGEITRKPVPQMRHADHLSDLKRQGGHKAETQIISRIERRESKTWAQRMYCRDVA